MSRSSFGQPPKPQLGMSGPKGLPGPMSAPKTAMQPPPVRPPPQDPAGGGVQAARQPSMFLRNPRYM